MDDYYESMTEKMSAEDKKAYGDYQTKECAERDLRTLVDAEEIKADKKRMQMVKHCAKSQKAALNNIG